MGIAHAPGAFCMGLVEAYDAALRNDPTYQSAIHENEAGQQNRLLGRAALLPTVAASYQTSKASAEITSKSVQGNNTINPRYTSSAAVLQFKQPLISFEGLARYRQGAAQSNYSSALFSGRSEDLVIRLVSAYADAKFAEDQLALATAQRDAYGEQMRVNDRMFAGGEGTKTDSLETQAKFDLSEAQVIEAADSVNTARNTLAAIVGMDVTVLDGLSPNFRVRAMQPAGFEEWKALALEKNAEIVALRFAVESARQEINKQRSGHLPRLDFVASVEKNQSNTINTYNQDSNVRNIGVQLNIPIYSGGYVNAATTQAVAQYEKAKSDLDAKVGQITVELRKQYSLTLSSEAHIDALVKSVKSADLLVEATRKSIKGGVRINLDLLNAQQQMYSVRRDLAQARYSYVLSYLRLRNAAGSLSGADVRDVAGYFVAGR
ncbi:MAG: TolC family outer membrane protein [Herminiimonas sp.]|nr:TolC family outer membrane protein [Herminiimonas sp.]